MVAFPLLAVACVSAAARHSQRRAQHALSASPGVTVPMPDVSIAGMGKCGTNALAVMLQRFGGVNALSGVDQERWVGAADWYFKQQGYNTTEINWFNSNCSQLYWSGEALSNYSSLFRSFHQVPPRQRFLYDESTAYFHSDCASRFSEVLPADTKVMVMACDPIQAVWSRMNHQREMQVEGFSKAATCDPSTVMGVIEGVATYLRSDSAARSTLEAGDFRPALAVVNSSKLQSHSVECVSELTEQLVSGMTAHASYGAFARLLGTRFKLLLTEQSKADPLYLSSKTAAFLGLEVRVPWQNSIGSNVRTDG